MSVNCNIYSVLKSATNCKPNLSGTGDKIYIFDVDACFATAKPDTTGGMYDAGHLLNGLKTGDNDKTPSFGTGIASHCVCIDIKANSGQVTSEKSEDGDFRQLTGTAVVDHSVDKFLITDASLAFKNIGVLIPANSSASTAGERLYYVIMSKYKKVKYSSNYDSGTTYDSDHGFTITFTVSPVTCACPLVSLSSTEITSLMPA